MAGQALDPNPLADGDVEGIGLALVHHHFLSGATAG
jgi:hypothetical protein